MACCNNLLEAQWIYPVGELVTHGMSLLAQASANRLATPADWRFPGD
ncbi:hypothetical protein [Serratia sp. ASV30]|nr:hypothetical protein [Serratia sp. ASV30]